jgi:hypothetical protein
VVRNDFHSSDHHYYFITKKNFFMRKSFVVLLAILISAGAMAQKGKNYVGGGADLSLPLGVFADDFNKGVGFYVKGLLGVGQSGAVTFTTGYTALKEIADFDETSTKAGIVPLLVGYRHNFNGFFVEPQLGYGLYPYKHSSWEGFYTETGNAFTWALGAGYMFNNKIEVSARYQSGTSTGTTIGIFGLRLGYNFSLGQSK